MPVLEENKQIQTRDEALEGIAKNLGVRAERGKRFAELTSLRVGGAIDWVISPQTEEEAAAVVYELDKAGIGWRALGSGSNVLADDGEHHYVVLSLSELKGEVSFDGERVSVSAGYSLPRLCIDVARQGLSGIEGLGGIPGTVGGALWMNAGAYGHEIGTVTETVRVAREGKVFEVAGESIEWNYRHTSFKEGELLLGATLHLTTDEPDAIKARMDDAKSRRLATQPHDAIDSRQASSEVYGATSANGVRPSSPAVATNPAGLHLSLLGDLERVVDLDPEVSDGALKFAVTK